MKKFILTESEKNEIKSLYKSKGLLKEEVSDSEKRILQAYALMVDASAGPGTNTQKIFKGLGHLNNKDEFYIMNSLFKDKKTGYSSFDEMIRGELEIYPRLGNYFVDPRDNKGDYIYILDLLTGLGVNWVGKTNLPHEQPTPDKFTLIIPEKPDESLKNEKEVDQLINQTTSGDSEPAPPGESAADTSSGSSSSTTTDTSDCESLFAEAEKQTTYNPANLKAGKVVIGKGNQGALVEAMQCYLNQKNEELSLGLTPLKTDGKFGDKTKEMTIKFQESQGLKGDGIIGKNTYVKFGIAE